MTPRRTKLTTEAEDYLKAIYELGRLGGGMKSVGTSALAAVLGVAAASVSGMLRRLARQGLVKTERYHGTRLTPAGRAAALQLIRRHRIIESYLVARLGFDWDDVHEEAERLEHAASADLVNRMAAVLGNPAADPHGAPIPTADGEIDERRFANLASLGAGDSTRVQGMGDSDAALLRYLADRGIRPGAKVRVESREPFDGPMVLTVGRERQTISTSAAAKVWVGDGADDARPRRRRRG